MTIDLTTLDGRAFLAAAGRAGKALAALEAAGLRLEACSERGEPWFFPDVR
jgi:hypothetical protein